MARIIEETLIANSKEDLMSKSRGILTNTTPWDMTLALLEQHMILRLVSIQLPCLAGTHVIKESKWT